MAVAAPAAAFEAADLLAIAGVCLLIGLLYVVLGLGKLLAGIFDKSILGVHPFKFIGSAIENTLIQWAQDGIAANQKVLASLLHAFTWSLGELLIGLRDFANGVATAVEYIHDHAIARIASTLISPLEKDVETVRTLERGLETAVTRDVSRLDTRIDSLARHLDDTLAADVAQAIETAVQHLQAQLDAVDSTIQDRIFPAISHAGDTATAAVDALRVAEHAAVDALGQAESLTANELRDLIARVNVGDIAALVAAVPLLATMVNVLEAETGLGNAECRSKIKQVCGTNPSAWGNLLADLAPLALGLSLTELLPVAREAMSDLVSVLEEVA